MECRICMNLKKRTSLFKLFGKDGKMVKQIEEITGILLEDVEDFPQFICKSCQQDLEQAHQFRERCIIAQEQYEAAKYMKYIQNTTKNHAKLRKNQRQRENERQSTCDEEESTEKIHIEVDDTLSENNYVDNVDFENATEEYLISNDEVKIEMEIVEIEATEAQTDCLDIEDGTLQKESVLKKQPGRKKKSNSFICEQCGNSFTSRYRFLTHLRRHTGDKQIQCEICPDKFFTHSELKRHMRRHTGERPFACKHCDRRFTDYSTRVKHERTHTNERPFTCSSCGKTFTTSYVLKTHMVIHTGERFFRCTLCNKSFQRRTNLAAHCRSLVHKQNEERSKDIKSKLATAVSLTL